MKQNFGDIPHGKLPKRKMPTFNKVPGFGTTYTMRLKFNFFFLIDFCQIKKTQRVLVDSKHRFQLYKANKTIWTM